MEKKRRRRKKSPHKIQTHKRFKRTLFRLVSIRVQELCESRGGRPGLSVLMSLTVSVDVKQHWIMLRHWSQFVPNMSTDIRGHEALHHHHSGKQKDLGSNLLRLSFLFKNCDLWILSCDFVLHNYETLKWVSSLPTLMQKSFWWWQCYDRYIISLSPYLHIPFPLLPVPNKPRGFCGR